MGFPCIQWLKLLSSTVGHSLPGWSQDPVCCTVQLENRKKREKESYVVAYLNYSKDVINLYLAKMLNKNGEKVLNHALQKHTLWKV